MPQAKLRIPDLILMSKIQTILYRLSAVLLLLQATACSNLRYLKEGESLYTGSEVHVTDTLLTKSQRKNLTGQLEGAIRPKPNSTFLKMRLKLTIYNLAGEPRSEKGLRNWLREKLGEPPVLGSEMNVRQNTLLLTNYLQNRGFFVATVAGDKKTEDKKTTGFFEVVTGPQSRLRKVNYDIPNDSSQLARFIEGAADSSMLKPGDPYNLDMIIAERERIDNYLKNKGYYYFNPDFIFLQADTGTGTNEVDLTLFLKDAQIPRNAYKRYRINEVVVLPNYRLNSNATSQAGSRRTGTARRAAANSSVDTTRDADTTDSVDSVAHSRSATVDRVDAIGNTDTATTQVAARINRRGADTTDMGDFKVVARQHQYRPVVFRQALQLTEGEIYNLRDQNLSLNRLVSLNSFKFIKNEFTQVRGGDSDLLNLTYMLTPYPSKSWNIDLSGFSQNDSRGGIRGSVGWRHRNLFKGAEQFNIKLSGSFEAQYGGQTQRPNSYNFGLESNLMVPRLIVPFFNLEPTGLFIPKTIFSVGYNYTLMMQNYQINALSFAAGYNWKESAVKDHKLFPFNLTFVRTDTLGNADQINFNDVSNLIFNGVILGPTYEFIYNTQLGPRPLRNNFYFSGLIDLSGNLLGLSQGAALDKEPRRIFGSAYAQYIKVQTDFRFYHNFTKTRVLAARLLLGYGYAYGNSYTLPNVKQFFAGGSSSLRGFSSRLVGPGTFNEQYLSGTRRFIEILGDAKLESSVEFREKIYSFIHGAVFADAGNVWLLRDNPQFPGGRLSKRFLNELGVDVGLGLRFDFSILVLRLDAAIPVRKPWYPAGDRWRFGDIDFGDPDWRSGNMFFNLAIGYPF